MKFSSPLIEARLIERYKRFLADVELEDGSVLTVHCPNPGAMMGLKDPGIRVWISDSQNPRRKLRHTLEMVEARAPTGPVLVGLNTMWPNRLAKEALDMDRIPQLAGFETLRTEVPYGTRSRIDILLSGGTKDDARDCYVEVKNVHLVRRAGMHEFPDCKTERGAKHLREMAAMVEQGHRAVMLYVIQRSDGDRFSLASDLDPAYADAFVTARDAGVEALAIRCDISLSEISAKTLIPIVV
ncbi:MAG: DNA/RNA nuclease SfsA [Pseudomonadota bacterium]